MKRKRKILYLITKSNWGGAQHYVFDLATNLDTSQFDVLVALGGNGRLAEELTKKNIRVITLSTLERDISILKEIKAVYELFTLIKNEQPDILHINSSKAGGLGAFIGRLCFVPKIIFTAHGWAFNEDRPFWQKIIIKALHWVTVVFAHTTISVSKATKRQMNLPFAQKKITVIHNGRNAPPFYERTSARSSLIEKAPALQEFSKDFWSVTIAELHPIKQHEVTIRALGDMALKDKKFRHIIIGDGQEKQHLQTIVQDLNLTDRVFFVSINPNASQYLKAFDAFILASRAEALAYVIIEACLAGLPVIASNVGGIPEIITHKKEGFLFPQGDAAMLSKYYTQLFDDVSLRDTFSKNALLRAQDFTLERMLEETVKLY